MTPEDRRRLAAALATWLPGRRWFSAKGRTPDAVEVTQVADLGQGLFIAVIDVRLPGEAQPWRYQLPVGIRRDADDPIVLLDAGPAVDATGEPELMAHLFALLAAGGERDGVRFVPERALEPVGPARLLGAEQSNTSVVFGDTYILKIVRRLFDGVNPEAEVARALGPIPALAPLAGTIEYGGATLAVMQGFAAGSVSGWDLAGAPGFVERMGALGEAVAQTHVALADAFGSAPLTEPDLADLTVRMRERLARVAADVPELAELVPALSARLADVGAAASAADRTQRVHGDLHLGQVLATDEGWLIIDFEGEPGTPISERAAWDSPLRDVAGVLRSIGYAASRTPDGTGVDAASPVPAWAAAAEREFLAGYRRCSDVPMDSALLTAYQIDKAVYEVDYEVRNRPEWVGVPLRGLRAFAAGD